MHFSYATNITFIYIAPVVEGRREGGKEGGREGRGGREGGREGRKEGWEGREEGREGGRGGRKREREGHRCMRVLNIGGVINNSLIHNLVKYLTHKKLHPWWYMVYIALILHVDGVPMIIIGIHVYIHIHPASFTLSTV